MNLLQRILRFAQNDSEMANTSSGQQFQAINKTRSPELYIPNFTSSSRNNDDRYFRWTDQLSAFYRLIIIFIAVLAIFGIMLLLLDNSSERTSLLVLSLFGCVLWILVYQQIADIDPSPDVISGHQQKVGTGNETAKSLYVWTTRGRVLRSRYYIWRYGVAIIVVTLGLLSLVLILVQAGKLNETLIIFPFVAVFPFSYLAYIIFYRPVRVETLRRDFRLLGEPWDEGLYQQSQGFWNFALHIILAIATAFIGTVIFTLPHFQPEAATTFVLSTEVLRAIGLGFLGAWLFSGQLVFRRFATYDLQPYVYLYCTLSMIAGMALNYAIFEALYVTTQGQAVESISDLGSALLDVLSLAIGFFPLLAIQWLTRIIYTAMRQPLRRSDVLRLDLIDGISTLHEVRLRDYGIDNIQNLAAVQIPHLLINTRFSAQQVIDWIDQALLYLHLEETEIDGFRRAKIRTVTDFCDMWHSLYPPPVVEDASTNAIVQARTAKALQLGVSVEQLDMLYHTVKQGPNYRRIKSYWRNSNQQTEQGYLLSQYNQLLLNVFNTNDATTESQWESDHKTAADLEQLNETPLIPGTGAAKAGLAHLVYRRFKANTSDLESLNQAVTHYNDAIEMNHQCNQAVKQRLKQVADDLVKIGGEKTELAVLEITPERRQALLEEARIFIEQAIEVSKQCYIPVEDITAKPHYPNVGLLLDLAKLYVHTNDPEGAIKAINQARAIPFTSTSVPHLERIEVLTRKIKELIDGIVANAKTDAQTLDSKSELEQTHRVSGLFRRAIDLWKQLSPQDIQHVSYLIELAEFQKKVGDLNGAQKTLQEANGICEPLGVTPICQRVQTLLNDVEGLIANSGSQTA